MYMSVAIIALMILASMFVGAILGRIDGESRTMDKHDSKSNTKD